MPIIGALITLVNGSANDAGEVNQNFSDIRTAFNTYAVLTDVARTITAAHTWNTGQNWNAAQVFPAGTEALPSVAIGGANDGFYRIGEDNIGLTLGGTKRWDFGTAGSTLTGTLTVSGAVSLQSTLGVTGAATFSSTVATGALTVTGAASISSTLSVTGAVTGGTYNGQTISATAAFTGSMTIATTLGVTGAVTLSSTLAAGNTTITGTLSVSGAVTGGTYNGQTISATASLTGSLAVAGNTTIGGTLGVTGAITASGGVTGALTGNASTATTLQTARNFAISGDITAPAVSFNGSGSVTLVATLGAHNHAATDITSGTMATARLGSGTANSTSFLRGDQSWQVVDITAPSDITLTGVASASFGSSQNNLARAAGIGRVRLNPTAAGLNVTGMAAGSDGDTVWLQNVSSETLTFPGLDGGSSAGNQWQRTFGILAGAQKMVTYDGTLTKWIPME